AAQAGAHAVKFQTFKAERIVTPGAPKAEYQLQTTDAAESQYEMLRRLELSPEAHHEITAYCERKGILFLSTPFDEESADFLEALGMPAFKIPSGEITNLPFLEHVARKGKPMIMSTGMSSLGEVEVAVNTVHKAGNRDLVLLHCVSAYPADPKDANIRAMQTMATAFGLLTGYSDHTPGIEVALAAVALGACVIEKHFTLDRDLPGPDHRAALEPDEMTALVRGIRTVEAALGHGRKEPAPCEANTAAVARKSIVAARDIPAGTALTENLMTIKRPGTGLPPSILSHLVGRVVTRNIPAGTILTLEMLR
ncbi:N-acetylneuraminate synthase, partial [Candidatus Uhrbacteria bacterium]|nr:N-acetylneuraminate synthase [Candidatus Uhrbacteria bacterium]